MTSAFRLDGKTAIITGGSRGLGLYAAEGLLNAGVTTVIITSRKAAACDEAVTFLKGKFPKANIFAIPADLSKASEVTRFIAGVKAAGISKVHICLANAGATWGAPFDTFPDSGFEKVFDLNVRSVFNLIRECAPLLEAAAVPGDPARVITVGSVAGIGIGNIGANATYSYAASKAAVHHLSKHLAVALGPRGILVNAIAPGFFVTKMAAGLIDKSGGEEALGKSTPNGRLGQPDDIAGVVTFLSSKAASHINGVVIPIDGGKHLLAGFDDAKAKM